MGVVWNVAAGGRAHGFLGWGGRWNTNEKAARVGAASSFPLGLGLSVRQPPRKRARARAARATARTALTTGGGVRVPGDIDVSMPETPSSSIPDTGPGITLARSTRPARSQRRDAAKPVLEVSSVAPPTLCVNADFAAERGPARGTRGAAPTRLSRPGQSTTSGGNEACMSHHETTPSLCGPFCARRVRAAFDAGIIPE